MNSVYLDTPLKIDFITTVEDFTPTRLRVENTFQPKMHAIHAFSGSYELCVAVDRGN